MRALRDFLGAPCPVCKQDILQRVPERARMPAAELAFCPACKSELTLEDLHTLQRPRGSFLSRLLGRQPSDA